MQYYFLLLFLFSIVSLPFSTSQLTPKVIEMSGDAGSVANLLQQIMEASQRQNINQHFRVRTVNGSIIMESDDYKPGALEHLN
ncbi:hypothetical protein L3Y34_008338 [Caenorhabditis briggsae]|uniref:Uncharacterized protein n=1 Tax=Caenorhabditis briggsae TaxID=6238 RepID=A0AAE9D023_CAEBR|nr:hypothetical protein L3Y34_008338 [Caenorhabditis briggsae]